MRRDLIAVALVLALVLAFCGPAGAAEPVPSLAGCTNDFNYEVCFNDPTSGDVQQRGLIFTRLRDMIGFARPGDEVRVAMFSWTGTGHGVARALARASEVQHASVAAVVGSGTPKSQIRYLRKRGVKVTVCRTSCTSHQRGSINHVKLFLMRLSGRKHVVVTSSNLTRPQRDKLYNNSVRSARDDALYDYYRAYWDRLKAKDWSGWGNAQRQTLTSAGNLGLVFQRTEGDTVANLLGQVRACSPGHAKVWVAMALFTQARPEVKQQLRRLRRIGCNVKVVIGNPVDKGRLFAGGGLDPIDPSKVRRAPIHHKFVILDAQVVGRVRQIVYTGSHNFTGNALLRNDEIWTGYSDPFVTNAFISYYKDLYARAQP